MGNSESKGRISKRLDWVTNPKESVVVPKLRLAPGNRRWLSNCRMTAGAMPPRSNWVFSCSWVNSIYKPAWGTSGWAFTTKLVSELFQWWTSYTWSALDLKHRVRERRGSELFWFMAWRLCAIHKYPKCCWDWIHLRLQQGCFYPTAAIRTLASWRTDMPMASSDTIP